MKSKKIFGDSILNILSVSIPLAILQFIVLPYVGKSQGQETYGIIVSLLGIAILVSHPLGGVLNNVRLLTFKDYNEKKIEGDFNYLLIIFIIMNSIVVVIGSIIILDSVYISIVILLGLYSNINLIREYAMVDFRIKLNYRKIFISNVILAFGYLFGFGLFLLLDNWLLVYFSGSLVSLVYIIKHTKIFKEKTIKTILFSKTLRKSLILFVSTFLISSLAQLDKFVILFILDKSSVTIYYTATIMAKIMALAITPISGVLLSHFAHMNTFRKRHFVQVLILVFMIGLGGYFVILFISPYLITFLYPEWANDSIALIKITTGIAIISVTISIINPMILKFRNINWQLIINGLQFLVTLSLSTLLLYFYGLKGFAIGILISSVIVLLLKISVFLFSKPTNVVVNNN